MDYQFYRNDYGQYIATLSSGQEALAHWINEELQVNRQQIITLLKQITQLQQQQCWEYQHIGQEFTLIMNQHEVEVRAMRLDDPAGAALDELSHYDQESQALCGLEDFRQLLEAWQTYTTSSHL